MWLFLLVRLLIAWGLNVLALIVVDWLFDGVYIEKGGDRCWARRCSRSATRS